jgi:hypothetical protein
MSMINNNTKNNLSPWKAHFLILQLESGLHMGYLKLGNIQRTRLYITGRSIWGALTARLTRLSDRYDYGKTGEMVNEHLAWSYFFPALKYKNDEILGLLPFYKVTGLYYKLVNLKNGETLDNLEARQVEQALLYSVNSTALDYINRTAQDQSLHEVEFISPRLLTSLLTGQIQKGSPVYFCGYVFSTKDAESNIYVKDWKEAFKFLQFGGERSYGGGLMTIANSSSIKEVLSSEKFFGYDLDLNQFRPVISVAAQCPIMAHHYSANSDQGWKGELEAVIGRETVATNSKFGEVVKMAFTNVNNPVCYVPGSWTDQKQIFQLGEMGAWLKI